MNKFQFRPLLMLVAAALLAHPPVRAASGDPIRLSVDATHAPERLYQARMVMPAAPGPLTPLLPEVDSRRARPRRPD